MKRKTKLQIQLKLIFNFEGHNWLLNILFSWTHFRGLVSSSLELFLGEIGAQNENATRVNVDFQVGL